MRLLIVQTGFLGDAVLATAMLRSLASARPDVEAGLLVRAGFDDILRGHSALHALHTLDKGSRGGMRNLVGELREAAYDVALLPHRSLRSALLARRAGIGRRIGFRQSDAPWLLTDRVEYLISRHETDRNAALLERAGIATSEGERMPWLVPAPAAIDAIRERLKDDPRRLIVLAPGSVWETKRWGVEGYVALARELRAQGCRVVLVGSRGERDVCEKIAEMVGLSTWSMLCGVLTLAELVALISMAERVVTNDSAPLHIAESVGTPVTAIFGPTVPEFGFGPRAAHSSLVDAGELPCRPCGIHGSRRCPIGTHECMTSIGAAEVLATFGRGG
jgi:heptosyltransferase-2